ncbi:hypothetical protein F4781DRAFT_161032 [Annulohypoxylon bovei var. microspora]|nr:hypothetical protein F4781DRAFT_161032 [Annulohypoxylon bovei var. microspora]
MRDEHFTKVICRIFKSLQKWNITRGSDKSLSFHLTIRGLSRNDISYEAVRGCHKHVGFHGFQVLPSLPFVTYIRVEHIDILPSTMAMIYKALPRMEYLYWEIANVPRSLDHLRVSLRESLASTLLETNFEHLKVLEIMLYDENPLNDNWKPENHVGAYGNDRLSLAVNRILKLPNLTMLNLAGFGGFFILSPAIFAQDEECGNISESLRCLILQVSKVTPDGRWYFTGDRAWGTAEDEWDLGEHNEFRNCPDPTTFDPFLIAIARGIARMPALRDFWCSFYGMVHIMCNVPKRDEPINSPYAPAEWNIEFEESTFYTDQGFSPQPWTWKTPSEFKKAVRAAGHDLTIRRGIRRF